MLAIRGRAALRYSATLVAFALLASACVGGDDDADDPNPPDSVPAVDADTIRLGIGGPLVVDPVEASLASPSDLMTLGLLYDSLTVVDADGVARPGLAASWTDTAFSTIFEFTLDPDATFTSGRAVTPEDVIASLERVMAAGDTSLASLSLEAVKGFRDFADGKADHVSGLSIPGAGTVRVTLTTPLSVLPVVLSSPMYSIVDPDTIGDDLADLDLTGAWEVGSAEDGGLVLDRRTDRDAVAHVDLIAHDDADDAYAAFEDGDVDWAAVPSDQYEEAVDEYGDDAFAPFQAELFFGMNVDIPVLKSRGVRHAIALAIDRDEIIDEVYAELADPLTTIIPAGIPVHDPERCTDCPPDPDTAAALVKAAYPKGDVPTLHIDFDDSEIQQALAELVAEDLEAVGIPTELRPLPLGEYEGFVVSGKQELFSFGWIGAYRSPDAYLSPLFGSSANDNLTGYRSAHVDALLADARVDTDRAANALRWRRAEAEVLDAAVVVPIVQFRTQVVIADRVQGFETAVDGTVDWSQVTVTD